MQAIHSRLTQDESLEERTTITVPDICHLTEMCLWSTYFQFQDTFFEQVEGAAMGSPLSPVVANLYMEEFENKALETATLCPRMWVRYVDDTFVLWPHGEQHLESFHQHLNSQHPAIQFTMEREQQNRIAFLDVSVERKPEGFVTSEYRKPTHTDRYINFASHHHP